MPTYEYRCPHCGIFERNQKISDPPLSECPNCGQAVKRLISRNIGIVFKGSGFYATDNRPSPAEGGSKEAKSDVAQGGAGNENAPGDKATPDKASSTASA